MTLPSIRLWTTVLAAVLAIASLTSEAQQTRRLHRIGVLQDAFAPSIPAVEGLKVGLKAQGLEGVQAARLVVKILRGARPQDLPAEGANKIELAINLKTAKSLGVTIPRELLARADHVIE